MKSWLRYLINNWMIKRKVKKCKSCGRESLIFSRGECEYCAKKRYRQKTIKTKKAESEHWSVQDYIKELDKWYSLYRRYSEANEKNRVRCYICGEPLHVEQAQLMHFLARAKYGTRFDDRNTQVGCTMCNVYLNGNLWLFEKKLKEDYGEDIIRELHAKANKINIQSKEVLKNKIEYYKTEVKKLLK